MIDSSQNAQIVTMERLRDVQASKEQARQNPLVRVDGQEAPLAIGKLAAHAPRTPSPSSPSLAFTPASATSASTTQPADAASPSTPDPDAAFRHTRLAVTAGLVLLLLVVWILQKRSAAR